MQALKSLTANLQGYKPPNLTIFSQTLTQQITENQMDHEADLDVLSHLPLCIIHIILALIPIKDTIRTSILSKEWRYKWTSLPCLVFNGDVSEFLRLRNDKAREKLQERTDRFIRNALLHHQGPIHRFEICNRFHVKVSNFEQLILSLSGKGIRELIIQIFNYDEQLYMNKLHSSIYSCTELTELELWDLELDPPPSTFKRFLFLKSLSLRFVRLSPDGVESLFANSPLLERLTITYSQSSELKICAPNLKYLYLVGEYTEICLDAPLLGKMLVSLEVDKFRLQNQSSVYNYTNFIGGFPYLEELSGLSSFIKFLSIGIGTCQQTLMFHHLKVIELHDVEFRDKMEISVVARLIIGTPHLKKLTITATKQGDGSATPDFDFRDFGCATNFKLEKLRSVNMNDLCGYASGMQFIEFLLESSPVLKRMNLGFMHRDYHQSVTAKLPGFRRASPNVKISLSEI